MPITDSTQRFSSRVDDYLRYRPGYPPKILHVLKSDCGLSADSILADVGCGTGFLARIFLENGNRVFGIEPNKEMREAGERYLADCPKFVSLPGTAENTGLPDESVDFVTAGQAAHWFDRQRARQEFIRILKRPRWAVLLWNERVTDSSPFMRGYDDLLHRYGTDYHEVHRVGHDTALLIADFFSPKRFHLKTFPNEQEFDFEGLKGRLLSSSYVPQEGHPNYEPMTKALQELFGRSEENGRVRLNYETRMYYGHLG